MNKRCCSKGLLITGNGAGVGKCSTAWGCGTRAIPGACALSAKSGSGQLDWVGRGRCAAELLAVVCAARLSQSSGAFGDELLNASGPHQHRSRSVT